MSRRQIGCLLLIIGVTVTVASCTRVIAGVGNGKYVIAYGAILVGLYYIISDLSNRDRLRAYRAADRTPVGLWLTEREYRELGYWVDSYGMSEDRAPFYAVLQAAVPVDGEVRMDLPVGDWGVWSMLIRQDLRYASGEPHALRAIIIKKMEHVAGPVDPEPFPPTRDRGA